MYYKQNLQINFPKIIIVNSYSVIILEIVGHKNNCRAMWYYCTHIISHGELDLIQTLMSKKTLYTCNGRDHIVQ